MTNTLKTITDAAVAGSGALTPVSSPSATSSLSTAPFADGSGWRGVYDELTARGYAVSIVQNPLTSFADDVAATRRVLNRQDGPAILVGHSYGGSVITEAGARSEGRGPRLRGGLRARGRPVHARSVRRDPAAAGLRARRTAGRFRLPECDRFRAGFAGDTERGDAAFLRDAQVPIAMAALAAPVTVAAWKTKPSWYVVATEDGAIAPELLRSTARRIGADTTEVPGSHVVFLTQPKAVADVIEAAAMGSAKACSPAPHVALECIGAPYEAVGVLHADPAVQKILAREAGRRL
jgi:pimeloyl-ACP methyl ester carboxylesterase